MSFRPVTFLAAVVNATVLVAVPWSAGFVDGATTAEASYQAAIQAYTTKNYVETVRQAEAAAQADPQHWQAWQLSGNARHALGDKKGALTVYEYSLLINSRNSDLKKFVDQLRAELGATSPVPPAPPAPRDYVERQGSGRSVSGSVWRIVLWGGMESSSLKDVEDYVKSLADAIASLLVFSGQPATVSVEGAKSTFGGGVEIGRALSEDYGMGLKFGYTPSTKISSAANSTTTFAGFTLTEDYTYSVSPSLIAILAGGWYQGVATGRLRYRGSVYAGAAILSGETNEGFDITIAGSSITAITSTGSFSGTGLAVEMAGELSYQLSSRLMVLLSVTYMLANIGSVNVTSSTLGFSPSSSSLDFDFSGIKVRGGLGVAF